MNAGASKYNERLFNRGSLRSKLHVARFEWLQKQIDYYYSEPKRIMELGSFDSRSLNYLPSSAEYHAYDANWLGGLDKARIDFSDQRNAKFNLCRNLSEFDVKAKNYDISICLETLEHLPSKELDAYLRKISEATVHYCFISVPNEQGIVFLAKHLLKRIKRSSSLEKYTSKEMMLAILGRQDKVKRLETTHKGFSHHQLIKVVNNYFYIKQIQGLPFKFLPLGFNFTIAMVLQAKPIHA